MVIQLPMLLSKIHRATITAGDVNYVGSIAIDQDLMQAADLIEGQQVDVLDVTNGARLTTYVIAGPAGTGHIAINGAAARLVQIGDLVIVVAYGLMDQEQARNFQPKVVHVDGANRITTCGSELGA